MSSVEAQILGDGGAFGRSLQRDLAGARGLQVAVAFAKESGLAAVDVESWCREGRTLQVLAGTDFFLTELELLRRLERRPSAECRVFHTVGKVRAFHPKLYLLDRGDRRVVYVGSSNFTRGGLAENIEANVRLEGPAEAPEIRDAASLFDGLFHGEYATAIRDEFAQRYREMQLAQRALQEYPAVADRRDALLAAERMLLGAYRAQQEASKRWLLVTSPENFAATMRRGVWARQSEKEIVTYTRGDVFFFHVKGGRGIAAFGMFTGLPYRDEEPVEGGEPGRALPWRIAIEPLGELRHGIDTKQVLAPLRPGAPDRWFSGFVQQSHSLDPADFAALSRAFEAALRAERPGRAAGG
jgi:HKD family nuclease